MNINERMNSLTRKEREIISCLVDVKENKGTVVVATSRYGISRQTVYNWIAQAGFDIEKWRKDRDWKTTKMYNWSEIHDLVLEISRDL